ncbi:MAG: tRNA pseudouridine55 synthase [Pyrinomonadaceae bacterium]|jgi:tRNA pseudouridine55 synthase|nr:tRNA pseudouridine55 synthase [Pyrinomonadaceae bacterium]
MDGALIIDKPAGWTSHDVVARVRRVLWERRVGHTGTLDPFATGVLVVLVGRATRLAQFLAGAEKEYEATVRFGYATETGDLTGARRAETTTAGDATAADDATATRDATGDAAMGDAATGDKATEDVAMGDGATGAQSPCVGWGRDEVERALESLRGEIEQVPPMYSAKKVAGRKLYELARRGVEVERAAVRVRVRELEVLEEAGGAWLRANEDGTCDMRVRVACSAGTYVRVLAEDLGARLGAGAHLSALRRTRAGTFGLATAVTLETLAERVEAGGLGELLITPDAMLPDLPFVHLTAEDARRARHGAAIGVAREIGSRWRDGERVRLRDGAAGNLIAVGVYDATNGRLQPRVMLDAGDEK